MNITTRIAFYLGLIAAVFTTNVSANPGECFDAVANSPMGKSVKQLFKSYNKGKSTEGQFLNYKLTNTWMKDINSYAYTEDNIEHISYRDEKFIIYRDEYGRAVQVERKDEGMNKNSMFKQRGDLIEFEWDDRGKCHLKKVMTKFKLIDVETMADYAIITGDYVDAPFCKAIRSLDKKGEYNTELKSHLLKQNLESLVKARKLRYLITINELITEEELSPYVFTSKEPTNEKIESTDKRLLFLYQPGESIGSAGFADTELEEYINQCSMFTDPDTEFVIEADALRDASEVLRN